MSRARASLLMLLTAAATSAMLLTWPSEETLMVHTVQVQPGELVQSISAVGVVGYAQVQPCISSKTARITGVHVSPGQQVKKGDLLFSLDTSAEEKALASLQQAVYHRQYAMKEAESAAAAFAQSFSLEWMEKEAELRAMIENSAIRAEKSGTVEAVYVQEGAFVMAQAVLGIVRGEDKCIEVAGTAVDWLGMPIGTAALVEGNGEQKAMAMLRSLNAPEDKLQTAVFQAAHSFEWEGWPTGQQVTVQVLKEIHPAEALIPLSAVDENRFVWYVENGRACCEKVDISLRNAAFVAEESRWAGRRIILSPQMEELEEGMAVREAVNR